MNQPLVWSHYAQCACEDSMISQCGRFVAFRSPISRGYAICAVYDKAVMNKPFSSVLMRVQTLDALIGQESRLDALAKSNEGMDKILFSMAA